MTKMTRRRLLQYGVAGGATLFLPFRFGSRAALAQVPGGTLPPDSIPKYVTPLAIPPAMPRSAALPTPRAKSVDYYEIAVRQFQQNILPAAMGLPTTVWSYGSANHAGSFNYPAFTIEATWRRPVWVKWINQLVDANGDYLPHLLPVDQTLHWANPPGGPHGRDGRGTDPTRYTGPVPIVTHLHGGHSSEESDGFPKAWYLPAAKNIPPGFARVGSFYQRFRAEAQRLLGQAWTPGSAVFQYGNDQRAATWSDRVGSLSGKTLITVIVFAIAWALLTAFWRRANPPLQSITIASAVLIVLGLVGTFPTFFQAFEYLPFHTRADIRSRTSTSQGG